MPQKAQSEQTPTWGGVWQAHHSGESNWYVNGYGFRTWGLAIQRFQGLAKKYQHGASHVKLPKDKAHQGKELVGLLIRGSYGKLFNCTRGTP